MQFVISGGGGRSPAREREINDQSIAVENVEKGL